MKNLDDFRAKYPDLHQAIFDEGRSEGLRVGQIMGESKKEAKNTDENLSLEQKAQAAWDKDPDLRFEFLDSFDIFLAFCKAEEGGRIKIAGGGTQKAKKDTPAAAVSTDESLPIEDRAKAAWEKNPDLRAEFSNNFDACLAFSKAAESGQVKITAGISRGGAR